MVHVFFPLLQSCFVYLCLQITLVDRMRTGDQLRISITSITVCFVNLFFWRPFDMVFLPYLAFVVSILCNYRIFFLSAMQFFPLCLSSWLVLLGDTKQSSSILCISLKCLEWISLFVSFPTYLCKWYGLGLAFCFLSGCPGFRCNIILQSFVVRFVSKSNSKFINILSFSD